MFNLDFLRNYNKQSDGKNIYVKPYTGNDGNTGLTPTAAVKTLAKALALATADTGDTVYLFQESNTGSKTTDYQTATLNWNKDGVHLIGVGASPMIGSRCRVAFDSAYNTASNLFTLSANNCRIEGIEFFAGVVGTNPTGCMSVSGMRNVIENCQISGIGATTNDISGAYSLTISGSENQFKGCYIGLDTVIRATAEAEIRITNGTRNMFLDCIINSYTSLTTFKAVLFSEGSAHTLTVFRNCIINNETNRTGVVTTTGAIDPASIAGHVVILGGAVAGYTGVVTADSTRVKIQAPIGTAATKDMGIAPSWDLT